MLYFNISIHVVATEQQRTTLCLNSPDSKPIVSSLDMKRRMEGRRLIKLSHIHSKRNTAAVEGDWVTIGVVAHKGEPRMSQNVSVAFQTLKKLDTNCW